MAKPFVWKPPKGWNPWPNAKPGELGTAIMNDANAFAERWNAYQGSLGQKQGQGNPYADLINQMLNQQRSDIRAESVADQGSRDAAIKRLLISYGDTPNLDSLGISGESKGVLGNILGDQRVVDLANQNTAEGTSVKARLDQANQQAQQFIPASLATRGTLRSGQTGYALAQQAQQDKNTRFDTLNEMLGNVESAVGGYAANERQRQRQLADAEMQAQMSAFQYAGDTGLDQQSELERQLAEQQRLQEWYQGYQQQQAELARIKAQKAARAAAAARARRGGGGGGGISRVL